MACPECRAVSKAAAATIYGGKFFCEGKRGEMHKRTQMELVRFKEMRQVRS